MMATKDPQKQTKPVPNEEKRPGYGDKKLEGPNRPST